MSDLPPKDTKMLSNQQAHVQLHQLIDEIDERRLPPAARTANVAAKRARRMQVRSPAANPAWTDDFAVNGRYYSFFELIRRIEWLEQRRVQSDKHPLPRDEFLLLRNDNRIKFAHADITDVRVIEPNGDITYAKRPGSTRRDPTKASSAIDRSRSHKRGRNLVLMRDTEPRPADISWPYAGRRYEVEVGFFGVHGATSPLPSPTLEVLAQGGRVENTRKDFFDFFHNHWLKYLFQIWRKYRYAIAFEPDAQDQYSWRILALVGLYPAEMRRIGNIPWSQLLGYVGLMMIRSKAPEVVARIIGKAFSLPNVQVLEFVRQWVMIPSWQRGSLGVANCTLGHDASLGDRVMEHSSKFALEVGPVSPKQFYELLPGRPTQQAMKRLVQFLMRDQLSFDLKVLVDTSQWRPDLSAGRSAEQARQQRLLARNQNVMLGRSQFLGDITASEVSVQLAMGS